MTRATVHMAVIETTIRLVNGKGKVMDRAYALCGARRGDADGRESKVTCPACIAKLEAV